MRGFDHESDGLSRIKIGGTQAIQVFVIEFKNYSGPANGA